MTPHPWNHKRLAVAEMATERLRIVPLPEDMLATGIGGASLGSLLHASYPDAFLLCAGPLTGSFAPASGLAMAVFPREGTLRRAPVLQGIGALLRQCGVDALALVGRAERPLVLRLRQGEGDLARADALYPPDASRAVRREALLRASREGSAALLLAGADTAQPRGAGTHLGAAPRAFALAEALRERNCDALVLEGGSALPPMPVPLETPLRARLAGEACFAEELAAWGARLPAGLVWRAAACFHCPAPCLAWVKKSAGGYAFCADHQAFAALIEACGAAAPDALAVCDLFGLDPLRAAPLFTGASSADMPARAEAAANSPGFPVPEAEAPTGREHDTESVRAAMVLGICPHLLRRNSSVSLEDLLAVTDADLRRRLPEALALL